MIVTLIGYRGSGKTEVARPLADRLGWDWIDADDEIESTCGKSIRDIFQSEGEPRFRQIERDVLERLLRRDRVVIAAGGGAVLDAGTRRAMQSAGSVVWLAASVDRLLERINADDRTAHRRPPLTGMDQRREIAHLLAKREPLYRKCATVTVNTDHLSVDEVVEQIVSLIAPLLSGGPTT